MPVWVLTTSLTSVLSPLAFCTLAARRLRYQPMRAPLASINGSDGLARPRHSVETLRNRRSCESDDHKGILLPSSSSPRPHNPIGLYQGLLLFATDGRRNARSIPHCDNTICLSSFIIAYLIYVKHSASAAAPPATNPTGCTAVYCEMATPQWSSRARKAQPQAVARRDHMHTSVPRNARRW